jgi:hypothetical protein
MWAEFRGLSRFGQTGRRLPSPRGPAISYRAHPPAVGAHRPDSAASIHERAHCFNRRDLAIVVTTHHGGPFVPIVAAVR